MARACSDPPRRVRRRNERRRPRWKTTEGARRRQDVLDAAARRDARLEEANEGNLSPLRFVGARAEAAGWKSTAVGSFGVADVFAKTYRDGATATMSIVRLGIPAAGAPGTYLLSGRVATVG
jgi:hypothetical protein